MVITQAIRALISYKRESTTYTWKSLPLSVGLSYSWKFSSDMKRGNYEQEGEQLNKTCRYSLQYEKRQNEFMCFSPKKKNLVCPGFEKCQEFQLESTFPVPL